MKTYVIIMLSLVVLYALVWVRYDYMVIDDGREERILKIDRLTGNVCLLMYIGPHFDC